jgi:hypothetical protein
VLQTSPAQAWGLSTDHRSTHRSLAMQVAVRAWPEVTLWFVPTYACWRNLIAPWGKQRRRLALKGRRFEDIDEILRPWTGHGVLASASLSFHLEKGSLTLEKDR